MFDSYKRNVDKGWNSCCQTVVLLVLAFVALIQAEKIPLPRFEDLRAHYPGYYHYGGQFRNHQLEHTIGISDNNNLLLHDTSALRLSYSLNKIGEEHSLGTELIRLSKFGHDSIQGKNSMQYIYLPIAFGPYLADKYGYPNISKLHQLDPVQTKHAFWAKQGILRVITYTVHGNQPKGHVALWDCYQFYQSKDWIAENSLVTVEFWESPDSNCTGRDDGLNTSVTNGDPVSPDSENVPNSINSVINDMGNENIKPNKLKHLIMPSHARHSSKKMRTMTSHHQVVE